MLQGTGEADVSNVIYWHDDDRHIIIPDIAQLEERMLEVFGFTSNLSWNWCFRRLTRSEIEAKFGGRDAPQCLRVWYHTNLRRGCTEAEIAAVQRHQDGNARKRRREVAREAKKAKNKPKLRSSTNDGDDADDEQEVDKPSEHAGANRVACGGAQLTSPERNTTRSCLSSPARMHQNSCSAKLDGHQTDAALLLAISTERVEHEAALPGRARHAVQSNDKHEEREDVLATRPLTQDMPFKFNTRADEQHNNMFGNLVDSQTVGNCSGLHGNDVTTSRITNRQALTTSVPVRQPPSSQSSLPLPLAARLDTTMGLHPQWIVPSRPRPRAMSVPSMFSMTPIVPNHVDASWFHMNNYGSNATPSDFQDLSLSARPLPSLCAGVSTEPSTLDCGSATDCVRVHQRNSQGHCAGVQSSSSQQTTTDEHVGQSQDSDRFRPRGGLMPTSSEIQEREELRLCPNDLASLRRGPSELFPDVVVLSNK
ncbi:hypothetical protein OIO90_002915 [Microbotryomycetes sp. JL221]|nr:hypothetical protein OIO90_002915 [Microbotryomycetes sp. JL221]